MKLLSFQTDGAPRYGLLVNGGIVDLGTRLGADCPTLRTALARHSVAALAEIGAGPSPDLSLDDATFLPVIPDPGTILCLSLHYQTPFAAGGHPHPRQPTAFTPVPASHARP